MPARKKSEVRSQKPKAKAADVAPAEVEISKAPPEVKVTRTLRVAFSGDPKAGEPPTGEVRIGMRVIELPLDVESVREGFDLEAGDARALVRSVAGFKFQEPKGAKR